MKKYDVVTIGDCFEDIFLFPEKAAIISDREFSSGRGLCFDYGDKVPIAEIVYQVGGSAANTAVNFSKLGLTTGIVSVVGVDSRGDKTIEYLSAANVATEMITRDRKSNSNISVIISYSGDRTIFTYHGVTKLDNYLPPKSLITRWIYLAPLGRGSEIVENRVIEIIAKTAAGLIWNPGSQQISKPVKELLPVLKLCNMLFVNREEAYEIADMSKRSSIEEVMKFINSCGAKIVVVTDGAKGAKCFDGQRFYAIAASGEKRVEATGAGDAFASTFSAKIIKSSAEKKNQQFIPERDLIEESLKAAIIVSGSVVGSVGAQNGLLSDSEIIKREKELVKIQPIVYSV